MGAKWSIDEYRVPKETGVGVEAKADSGRLRNATLVIDGSCWCCYRYIFRFHAIPHSRWLTFLHGPFTSGAGISQESISSSSCQHWRQGFSLSQLDVSLRG